MQKIKNVVQCGKIEFFNNFLMERWNKTRLKIQKINETKLKSIRENVILEYFFKSGKENADR